MCKGVISILFAIIMAAWPTSTFANPITYSFVPLQGVFNSGDSLTVAGTITTDGVIGDVQASDITSWMFSVTVDSVLVATETSVDPTAGLSHPVWIARGNRNHAHVTVPASAAAIPDDNWSKDHTLGRTHDRRVLAQFPHHGRQHGLATFSRPNGRIQRSLLRHNAIAQTGARVARPVHRGHVWLLSRVRSTSCTGRGAYDFLAKPFGLEPIKGVLSAAFSRAIGC